MNRRQFILAGVAAPFMARPSLAAPPQVLVYKSPTCGCCSAWVEHMARAGFAVETRDVEQDALWAQKRRAGVTQDLASCHTAFVGGYVVEGHVPAQDIRRLLEEAPDALGLTVPGMPIGSPGMEMGGQRDPFETLLLRRGGGWEVFARHG